MRRLIAFWRVSKDGNPQHTQAYQGPDLHSSVKILSIYSDPLLH